MKKEDIERILNEANNKLANLTDKQIEYHSSEYKKDLGRKTINDNRSIESASKGGKIGGPKGGKTSKDNKLGFHALSKEERSEIGKRVGKEIGPRSYKEGFGMFGLSEEEKLAVAKYAAQQSINSPNHVNNKRLICPNCGKEGGYTAMKRWHMDNCKHKS